MMDFIFQKLQKLELWRFLGNLENRVLFFPFWKNKRMYKSVVYKGEEVLGEVEIYPQLQQEQEQEEDEETHNNTKNKKRVIYEIVVKEIRISHFSPVSERCPPLGVLHTITPSNGVCFKMEESTSNTTTIDNLSPLHLLHSSCIQENKV